MFHLHRWDYRAVIAEHHLEREPGMHCDAHVNGQRHLSAVPIRYCWGCHKLQGWNLIFQYAWGSIEEFLKDQDANGFIGAWRWPVLGRRYRFGDTGGNDDPEFRWPENRAIGRFRQSQDHNGAMELHYPSTGVA